MACRMHYHTARNEDDLRSKQGESQVRKTAFFATLCLALSTAVFAAPPATTPAPAVTPAPTTTTTTTTTKTSTDTKKTTKKKHHHHKKGATTPTPTPTPSR
jgi:hypothetical protein